MTQFSDPAWWPKPPPKPPTPISIRKVLFGTLLPILAVAGFAAWVITQHHSSEPSATRSIAAFESCIRAHGVTGGSTSADQARQASQACAGKLPPGTRIGSFGGSTDRPTASEEEAFNECMRSATAGIPRRPGSAESDAMRNAVDMCRALTQTTSGTTTTAPATTTTTIPSVA
jgi:hypothetical protein